MNDKDILYQIISRELGNLIGSFNPSFKMFTPMIMNSLISLTDRYVDMFISPDTSKLNTKAVAGFLKEETDKKIEDFLKRFEEESNKNGM